MCNFAAQLKHVAYREKLIEIQRDNTFRRETLKSSKKARYKSKWQSDNYQAFTLSLLNISKKEDVFHQTILTRFFQERLLYRMSQTRYRDNFYLKGGTLMYAYEKFAARPTLDIDFLGKNIGFGDVVTPSPIDLDYPTLLESLPAVNILAYSLETVIAEKFHAVVDLADQNSRMKDYYDLCHLLSKEKIVISPFYGEATYFLYLWNMANH